MTDRIQSLASCDKSTTARPFGCPSWCDLGVDDHEPHWDDGALRVDHERLWHECGVGTVSVVQEAAYLPDGDCLRLTLGPVLASCEGSDKMTAANLREFAELLRRAATLVEEVTR